MNWAVWLLVGQTVTEVFSPQLTPLCPLVYQGDAEARGTTISTAGV